MRQPRLEDTTVQVRGGAQGASQSLNVTHWFVAGPYQPLATQPGGVSYPKEKSMFSIAHDNTSRLVNDTLSQNPVQMPGTEDFVPVVSVDVGGYEWAELHAWYSPGQRRYFWSGQHGCSCNSYEVSSLGALQVGSKDDLLRSIKEWVEDDAKYYGADGITALQAVRDFKEPRR